MENLPPRPTKSPKRKLPRPPNPLKGEERPPQNEDDSTLT